MRVLADPSESVLLSELHAASFPAAWTAESFGSLLKQPGTFACIAEANAGFILVRVASDEAEILTLAVGPAARRRGIGTALVATAAEEARRLGARRMYLEVGCTNFAARTLYKGLGFVEIGKRPAYYAPAGGIPEDALLCRVEIPLPRVGKWLQLG